MRWSVDFTDLVVRFASRVAEVSDRPIEDVLLTSTPFYLNFGLDHFNAQHPLWRDFVVGYRRASNPANWSHAFYLAHPRTLPDSTFGCFSYWYEGETQTVRFHFVNRDLSRIGTFNSQRAAARRQELATMFAAIRRNVPDAEAVRGRSWMYNLPSYCRLFPAQYVESARPVLPELQFMSLWGQFLDRHGDLRQGPAEIFLARIAEVDTLADVIASFPLPVLAPRCDIRHFYEFLDITP
ncbi:MAG: hypothetical protein NVSMB52_14870 [Chloroflexota bacterium]